MKCTKELVTPLNLLLSSKVFPGCSPDLLLTLVACPVSAHSPTSSNQFLLFEVVTFFGVFFLYTVIWSCYKIWCWFVPNLLFVRETTYCANANARGKIVTGPLRISLITEENMYHAHLLIPLLLASLLQLFLFHGLLFFFFFLFPASFTPGAQSSSNYWSLSRSGSLLFIAVCLPNSCIIFTPISRFFLLAILHFTPSLRPPISSARGLFFPPAPPRLHRAFSLRHAAP